MMALNRARITGFVALAALGVIFAPMLFDGAGMRESELQVQIPDAPPFPVMEASNPVQPLLPDTREVAPPLPEPTRLRQPRMATVATAPESDKPIASESQPENDGSNLAAAVTPALSLAKEVPVLDTQGVPVAWTLQLAAFKDRENAVALRDRLQKAGYKAYVREKSNLTRVYVGPEVQRSTLETLKAQFQRDLKLDGLILRFTTG